MYFKRINDNKIRIRDKIKFKLFYNTKTLFALKGTVGYFVYNKHDKLWYYSPKCASSVEELEIIKNYILTLK